MRMPVVAALLALSAPASATIQSDPLPAAATPTDRAAMVEVADALATRPPDLARLDAVLARLTTPSRLRGMVQVARATVLASTDRVGDTTAAIEEAMRLLPDDPVPQLTAAHIMTFAGAPQRACDLWLAVSDAESKALVARIAALFSDDRTGRALNMEAAKLTLAANDERWDAVQPSATAFVASAAALGPSVNGSATLMVRAMRVCALWKLGRRDAAEPVMAGVLLVQATLPGAALRVHLCRADHAAARYFLLARLADENTRGWALRAVQRETLDPATAFNRSDDRVMAPLRRDPAVIAAVAKVGRVLPAPVGEALLKGFDPLTPAATARPVPGST